MEKRVGFCQTGRKRGKGKKKDGILMKNCSRVEKRLLFCLLVCLLVWLVSWFDESTAGTIVEARCITSAAHYKASFGYMD